MHKIGMTKLLPVAYVFVFIFISVYSVSGLTPTHDEAGYFNMGKAALQGKIENADAQRLPIAMFNAFFSGFFHVSSFDQKLNILVGRIPTIFFGVILGLYVMFWSLKLYGYPGMVISGALYSFCPNILAHSHLVTSDIYFSLFVFMSLYHASECCKYFRVRDVILLSVAFALQFLSKQTSMMIYALVLGVMFYFMVVVRRKIKMYVYAVVSTFVCVYVVLNWAYGNNVLGQIVGYAFSGFDAGLVPHFLPPAYVESMEIGVAYNRDGMP